MVMVIAGKMLVMVMGNVHLQERMDKCSRTSAERARGGGSRSKSEFRSGRVDAERPPAILRSVGRQCRLFPVEKRAMAIEGSSNANKRQTTDLGGRVEQRTMQGANIQTPAKPKRSAYIRKEVWWERYGSVERIQRRHRLTAGLRMHGWSGSKGGLWAQKCINLEVWKSGNVHEPLNTDRRSQRGRWGAKLGTCSRHSPHLPWGCLPFNSAPRIPGSVA